MITRRAVLLGIGAALAAPAIIRTESLMKIAALRSSVVPIANDPAAVIYWLARDGFYVFSGGPVEPLFLSEAFGSFAEVA